MTNIACIRTGCTVQAKYFNILYRIYSYSNNKGEINDEIAIGIGLGKHP
jgi:hypothetical protein